MSSPLALLGGTPTCKKKWKPYNSLDTHETRAVQRVLKSGKLSCFLGAWGKGFLGGPEIRALETEWAAFFGVKHAISMNSATSCLYAAIGALRLGAGDQVIVPPATMSATVMAPLVYGAIPVFADIDPHTFTLDPLSVEKKITKKTRAILSVNLFGNAANYTALLRLCKKYKLFLIEDNSQGPGATYQNKPLGTLGDIGVFSLNYHKHIHSGEGGMCVTRNQKLAERLQLIRNHAESVVSAKGEKNLCNLIGWNYRLTEIQAAIAREQLKKLAFLFEKNNLLGEQLRYSLMDVPGIRTHAPLPKSRSAYYVFPVRIMKDVLNIDKNLFVKALRAEGVPVVENYVPPLYQLPLFQKKAGFGKDGYPFSSTKNRPLPSYKKGSCPVYERLYQHELFYIPWCLYGFNSINVGLIARAIRKIAARTGDLLNG